MIFVTLGSQKFQFNRLLKKIDELISDGIINEEVFAQIGESTYTPKQFSYTRFLNREEFSEYMEKCNIVITHGGTGVIINAVKKGKKVIAVPRLKKYNEHVDNHQLQLLKEFEDMRIIETCYDINRLEEKYRKIPFIKYEKYESNTGKIITNIEKFIEKLK